MTAARSDLPLPLSPFSAQFGFHIIYFSRPTLSVKENKSFAAYPCPRASFLSQLITIDSERFERVLGGWRQITI